MNLVIDRELFVRIMFNLERQFHHDERCRRAFSVILPHADITGYDNRHIEDQLVELLQRAFDDEGQSSWIWYFIYEAKPLLAKNSSFLYAKFLPTPM